MQQHWQTHSLAYTNILRLIPHLDQYADDRRKVFDNITDPVSSSNFTRVMQNPPEKAEDDDFFKHTKNSQKRRREILLAQKNMRTSIFWGDEKIVE